LGLRHNFKATSIFALDEINSPRVKGKKTFASSVMDYTPINYRYESGEVQGDYAMIDIGPYDFWAIEYGYRPADGTYKPGDEDDGDQEPGQDEASEEQEADEDSPLKKVPKEALDKLPPEVKELLESDVARKMLAAKAPDEEPQTKPEGPKFTGPNAGERKMLHQIASRAGEPELVYASDIDTTALGPDPRSNRYDMGSNPIEWAQLRIDLVDQRLDNILEWAVKDGESWYHLRQAFVTLLFEKVRVLDYVGRYIGGQYTTRAHRGDENAGPPLRLVDADEQRKAFEFIEDSILRDDFFTFSPEVLNHLGSPRWAHSGVNIDLVVDFPVHRIIGLLQWFTLSDRLFPNTLRRIHDAEMKTANESKLTVAEYLRRIQGACWEDSLDQKKHENCTDASPCISRIRRSLQREYLDLMEPLVRTRPGAVISPDLHAMVQNCLRNLSVDIGNVAMGGALDFASLSHLISCKSRIDRILEPELEEYGYFGMGF
jgi:hypothetical protein